MVLNRPCCKRFSIPLVTAFFVTKSPLSNRKCFGISLSNALFEAGTLRYPIDILLLPQILELGPSGLKCFWIFAWVFSKWDQNIFLVVGHIPVETFPLVNYFFDATHTSKGFFKRQANPRRPMTAFSFLALFSTNILPNKYSHMLGRGLIQRGS